MKSILTVLLLSAALGTTGCAQLFRSVGMTDTTVSTRAPEAPGAVSYCDQRPDVCTTLGAQVSAGVVYIDGTGASNETPPVALSDTSLKTDITRVDQLESGINLYAFRYKGGSEMFVGVLAEELLADPRFADAVSDGPDGYLQVDYSKIGVETVDGERMAQAGLTAIGYLAIKQRTPI